MWQVILDGLSVLSEKWPVVFGAAGILCLGCSPIFFLFRDAAEEKRLFKLSILLLVLFFAFLLILRLAFIEDIFVPPYFDSVEHFRLIKELTEAFESSTLLEALPRLTPNYYHLGFHFLASLLALGLRTDPMDVILVFGQVILAAMPFPLFFLLRRETGNDVAAFIGILLAGFGWYMPGFAVNWGKYPALTGLLALEVVLGTAYFISRKMPSRNQSLSVGLLILGIGISVLIHSRTLVIFFISFVSWIIASKLHTSTKKIGYLTLGILLAGILVLGILIQNEPLLNLALDPYLDNGVLITITVLVLSVFAFIKFSRGVYFSLLFILGIFACLFIPLGGALPGFENQTLLDRPFVEMVLYFPLSILGGLGLAGLLQILGDLQTLTERIRLGTKVVATSLFIGFVGIVSLRNYDFYPSDCCNFVRYVDTVAIDWMDTNLPSDARILIASTEMNVLSSEAFEGSVGTDAGIWIPQLIGREIISMPYGLDYHSTETRQQLCQKQVDYVYVGGTDQSFSPEQLEEPELYKKLLSLPDAQVYQFTGCSLPE